MGGLQAGTLFHHILSGVPLQCIERYLSNRKQYGETNETALNVSNITSGVLQGYIIGIFLFWLGINDLLYCLQANTILYSSSTNIFVEANSMTDLYRKSNYTLTRLQTWLFHNLYPLQINIICHILSGKHNSNIVHNFNNSRLKQSVEIKFLRIIIQQNLNLSKHIEHIALEIPRTMQYFTLYGTLFRWWQYILYYSFVHLYSWIAKVIGPPPYEKNMMTATRCSSKHPVNEVWPSHFEAKSVRGCD